MDWDEAWADHAEVLRLHLPHPAAEALEVWPTELLAKLLPRHLEIIYQINDGFLREVREAFPGDEMRARRMSIITTTRSGPSGWPIWPPLLAPRSTASPSSTPSCCATRSCPTSPNTGRRSSPMSPMASARAASSASPTGTSARPHQRDDRHGLGHRPRSAGASSSRMPRTPPSAPGSARSRPPTRSAWPSPGARDGIVLPEGHLLDVMVKRLHEYKRQTLKLLHILSLYEQIISGAGPGEKVTPRTWSSSARRRHRATRWQGDHLLDQCGRRGVNADPRTNRLCRGLPGELQRHPGREAHPAADLSEQISLAGKEASGTGNMKFALNGA
jgi:starch phosphorylase